MNRKALPLLLSAAAFAAVAAPAPAAAQQPITLGQTVSGMLDESDPAEEGEDGRHYDRYTYRGRAGELLLVRMESEEFDTYLMWGRGQGAWEEVENDDDGGAGTNSRMVVRLDRNGTYEIRASAFAGDQTGPYTLTVERAPQVSSTPITTGGTLQGTLAAGDAAGEEGGWVDYYTFRGNAGDIMTVRVSSDDFDTVVGVGRLEDGEFEELESNDDDDQGDGTHSRLVFQLDSAGTYAFRVRAYSQEEDDGGAYTIALEPGGELPPDCDENPEAEGCEDHHDHYGEDEEMGTNPPVAIVGALTAGQATNGQLGEGDAADEESTPYDDYTFQAAAGDRLVIEVRSDEFDPTVAIGLRDGTTFQMLEYNDDTEEDDAANPTNSRLEYAVEQAGTYIVRVMGFMGGRGAYTVHVRRGP
ncbi:MAG TPA: PPC domain-containing protein [Longimicrobium sp.]|nr:PPC domain-containing protein [Longimicrobium sp.]